MKKTVKNWLPPLGVVCKMTPNNRFGGFESTETQIGSVIAYHRDMFWWESDIGSNALSRTVWVSFEPIIESITDREKWVEAAADRFGGIVNLEPLLEELYDALTSGQLTMPEVKE